MQRYIYGNIGKAGFKIVSSDPAFIAHHAGKLAPLMDHPTAAPRCFRMLTTDLMILGGSDHLYLQESSLDAMGNPVVQGYQSDPGDGHLYGPAFLKLLDTAFVSTDQALAAAMDPLAPTALDDLPMMDPLAPEPLEQTLLEGVLLTVLHGAKRAVIRIPQAGEAAMTDFKKHLKAIYQRLPYEARVTTGCLTGATSKTLVGLSPAYKIVLMDGSQAVEGLHAHPMISFFDLAAGAYAPIPKEADGKPLFFVRLIEFLATQPPEKLDDFFRFCSECLKLDGAAGFPGLAKYCQLLDVYFIEGSRISGDEISRWAVNLHDIKWTKSMRQFICEKIAAAMPADALLAHLKSKLPAYADLTDFGIMDEDDAHGALTLAMMASLPNYDLAAVQSGLETHLVAMARGMCPGLEKPTSATLAALEGVLKKAAPQPEAAAWANLLRNGVAATLQNLKTETERIYYNELAKQKTQGERMIQAWPTEASGWDLDGLYRELGQHYLYQELIAGWNKLIAQRLVAICAAACPKALTGYTQLLEAEKVLRQCFLGHSGTLLPAQANKLDQCRTHWTHILELCAQDPTVEEWDRWTAQLDAAQMDGTLALEVKRQKAGLVLGVVPKGATLEQAERHLQCSARHTDLLAGGTVRFDPWGTVDTPRKLLEALDALRRYKRGDEPPALENGMLRDWIVSQLPENKDLMLLLILSAPLPSENLVRVLAQKGASITEADILRLYVFGYSRAFLCETVAGQASGAWREAVRQFSPELPTLPPRLAPHPRRRKHKT